MYHCNCNAVFKLIIKLLPYIHIIIIFTYFTRSAAVLDTAQAVALL
jgi:hypothetical protein